MNQMKEIEPELYNELFKYFSSIIPDNDNFYSDYDEDNDNYCVFHTNNTDVYARFSTEEEADEYAKELNTSQKIKFIDAYRK